MKSGEIYIIDWDEDGMELGEVKLYGNTIVIETEDFVYFMDLTKWELVGEL